MKPSNGNLLNDGHDNGTKGGLSVKKYVTLGNLLWPKSRFSFHSAVNCKRVYLIFTCRLIWSPEGYRQRQPLQAYTKLGLKLDINMEYCIV